MQAFYEKTSNYCARKYGEHWSVLYGGKGRALRGSVKKFTSLNLKWIFQSRPHYTGGDTQEVKVDIA
jgi:hypothetical protein